MHIPLTTSSACAALFFTTVASSNVRRRGPYQTAVWGGPRPIYAPLEEIHSEDRPARSSYALDDEDVSVEHLPAAISDAGDWKNAWTAPLGYEDWRHDHEAHDEQSYSDQQETQQQHSHPYVLSEEDEHEDRSGYDYPGPSSLSEPDSSSSLASAELLGSLQTKTSPATTSYPIVTSVLHRHPQRPYPTLSTAPEIYSAPTTIYETRTFTYSYLEDGKKKLAVTTIIGDWEIEQPAVAVSTVWVTMWMDDEPATEVATVTSSTSDTFTPSPRTASPTVKPANPSSQFKQSTNGKCGILADMLTCAGTEFGQCCSQFGFCGGSAMHCGDGCQANFGECEPGGKPVKMPSLTFHRTSSVATSTRVPVPAKPSTAESSTSLPVFIMRPTATVTEGARPARSSSGAGWKPTHKGSTKPASTGKKHKTLKEILEELHRNTHARRRRSAEDRED